MAATNGKTGDHRNDWFRAAANLHLQIKHVEVRRAAFVDIAFIAAHLLVAARAEGFATGTGQDDRANAVVVMGPVKGIDQLADCFGAESVAFFRAIDRDPGDSLGGVVEDIGVGLGRLPVDCGHFENLSVALILAASIAIHPGRLN